MGPSSVARTPGSLVRPAVRDIEPYDWEESTESLARRLGLAPEEILRFDMNTSPLAPPGLDEALDQVRAERRVNEYFDARYTVLTERIAAYNGVGVENVLLGVGADEVLSVIVTAFIEPGRRVAMLQPTFPMCALYAAQHGGSVVGVPYDEAFGGPVDGLIAAAQQAHLVFVCSPNNPSGTALNLEDLERLIGAVPCAVVVDEAYFEYHGQTVVPLLARNPHVIVVRTFSKAFSMAGVRVGYALAAPEMIGALNRLRPPNSVTYMSVRLAETVLGHIAEVRAMVAGTIAERERVQAQLRELGLTVWPSRANFLLFRVPSPSGASGAARAARIHRQLRDRGLVLRGYREHPRLGPYLRMTIRTPEQNTLLLGALREALAAHA